MGAWLTARQEGSSYTVDYVIDTEIDLANEMVQTHDAAVAVYVLCA